MHPVTRVLLLDDEAVVRAAVCFNLSKLPNLTVVAETGSGKEAIRLCEELKPDLVLLDIRIKDMSGLEVPPILLKKWPNIKIIILTASLDTSLIPIFFSYGVMGFFNKESGFKELTTAIQYVLSGRTYISACFEKKIHFDKKKTASNPLDLLSERELQVALLIYYGFNTNDICKKLDINVSTLKTYRARLYDKLGIQNDVEITVLIERFKLLANSHLVHGAI